MMTKLDHTGTKLWTYANAAFSPIIESFAKSPDGLFWVLADANGNWLKIDDATGAPLAT